MSSKSVKKIVVFTQNRNFFGAQIVHIPLLKLLRSAYPNSDITIFSKHKISQLLVELKAADRLVLEEDKMQTYKRYMQINPDITVSLRQRSLLLSAALFVLNRKMKIGFSSFANRLLFTKTAPSMQNIYRACNYTHLAQECLELPPLEDVDKDESNEGKILIFPGAGGEEKIWPLENFIAVASTLHKKTKLQVAFVLGEKERPFVDRIRENCEADIYMNLPIEELFSVVKSASLVIANDCGPSHIAHILDKKRVVLFSDADYKAKQTIAEWFKESPFARYVVSKAGEGMESISSKSVLKEAQTLLESSPQRNSKDKKL